MILLVISRTWKTIIMLALLIAVFYFFMIRPQNQKAKREAAFRDGLKKGDPVITAGGIHGLFVSRQADMATIEVTSGHHIKVQIQQLNPLPTKA
ncbi:MAG: preprotein translocase subunit YajC [Bacteroidales bacterium]|nr:preprotein translocase subunit YajC [Bacteroidales bacterium]